MKVLVTGGSRRASLTIARSLGIKGIHVVIGDYKKAGPTTFSRYINEIFFYSSPQLNPEKYIRQLLSRVKVGDIDVLLPVHDFELIPLLKYKKIFEQYCEVPFVSYEIFEKTLDKASTIDIAKKVGVPVPLTYNISDLSNLEDLSHKLNYPLVIKPKSQTNSGKKQSGFTTSYITSKNYVKDRKELLRQYSEIHKESAFPLVQEYIEGHGAGVACLYNRGKQVVSFSYERIREYPISGGPSTLRRSIYNKKLIDYANDILDYLNWHGVAMVEFKVQENGKPYLMEINGRFWGSLALSYHSGIDFPFSICQVALNKTLLPFPQQKEGIECRWLIPGDILNFLQTILSASDARKDNAFKDFFNFFDKKMHYDYLSLKDPLPTLGALITVFQYFVDFIKGKRTISGEYN